MNELINNFLTAIVCLFSILDLSLTAIYLNKYKNYQPEMSIERIEANIIIRKAIKTYGLKIGLVLSSTINFLLIFGLAEISVWYLKLIYILILWFAVWNHKKNLKILKQLKKKFPRGFKELKNGEIRSK